MEAKKKITIQDIAARSGVSATTVSRVLNHHTLVADDTRQAVQEAIRQLNYKPNLFAQGLASGEPATPRRTRTVGVLTQDISSPFFDAILRGVMDTLHGTPYVPIFADGGWQAEQERQALSRFLERSVDGLIVISGALPESELIEVAERVPLIVVARQIPALPQQCLFLDNISAAERVTRYLIECGHQRIAHISGLHAHRDAADRLAGYQRALEAANLNADPELIIEGDFTEASGVLAVEMLMTRGRSFSAVFAANDQMAYGARLAFYRRGIRVPEDVSLAGFDDQAPSAYMTPPLTSLQWPPIELGKAAVSVLLQRMNGQPAPLPDIPARLVLRESVARR